MGEGKFIHSEIVDKCIEHASNQVIAREQNKSRNASRSIDFKFYKNGAERSEERTLLHLNDSNFIFYIKEFQAHYKKHFNTEHATVIIRNSYINNTSEVNSLCKKIIFEQCYFYNLATCGYSTEFTECHIPKNIAVLDGLFRSCIVHECCVQKKIVAADSKFTSIKLSHCRVFFALGCEIGMLKVEGENQLSSQAGLHDVKFLSPIVNAHNISFASRNVDINNITFRKVYDTGSIASFRCMKHACQEAEYEHGSILFHGYELEAHYNVYLKKNCPASRLPEKIGHWIHRGFTDYGRDIMRPFMCLAYLFILAGWISFAHYGLAPTDALLLSFKQSVGPMAFALNSDFWKELKLPDPDFIGFFHIITSSLIWFLIIFMIRRRFKI